MAEKVSNLSEWVGVWLMGLFIGKRRNGVIFYELNTLGFVLVYSFTTERIVLYLYWTSYQS